jgi:hypothetical protein
MQEFHLTRMKLSLRQVLADSHVCAVAIAVLLIWSFNSAVEALWEPFFGLVSYLITAIAILGLPYIPTQFTFSQRGMLIKSCFLLFNAFICLASAWLLSHWVYGEGPLRSLCNYRERFARGSHA